jgi:hypothetical protein
MLGSKPDGYKLMFTANTFFAITIKTQKTFDPSHLVLWQTSRNENGLIVRRFSLEEPQ